MENLGSCRKALGQACDGTEGHLKQSVTVWAQKSESDRVIDFVLVIWQSVDSAYPRQTLREVVAQSVLEWWYLAIFCGPRSMVT
jgi:hypothetical protein